MNLVSEFTQSTSQLAKSRYCVLSFRDERMIGCDVDEADIKVARGGAVLRDKLVASGDCEGNLWVDWEAGVSGF